MLLFFFLLHSLILLWTNYLIRVVLAMCRIVVESLANDKIENVRRSVGTCVIGTYCFMTFRKCIWTFYVYYLLGEPFGGNMPTSRATISLTSAFCKHHHWLRCQWRNLTEIAWFTPLKLMLRRPHSFCFKYTTTQHPVFQRIHLKSLLRCNFLCLATMFLRSHMDSRRLKWIYTVMKTWLKSSKIVGST